MPVQRKVFRIEESARLHVGRGLGASVLQQHGGILNDRDGLDRPRMQIADATASTHELAMAHAAAERSRAAIGEFAAPSGDKDRIARASRELAAITVGTERATQSILQAAEEIDQAASMLAASLKGVHDCGLAQDIQDRVVQIFEACNFHDLTGQRVHQVMQTLKFVEEHVARPLAICHRVEHLPGATPDDDTGGSRHLLNGPKLPGDRGHSSQDDIDTLF